MNKQAYLVDALTEYLGERPKAIKWIWNADYNAFAVIARMKRIQFEAIVLLNRDRSTPQAMAEGVEECEFAGATAAALNAQDWTKVS